MSLIDELYRSLSESKKVVYWTPDKTEMHTRCPYCGDSIRSSMSAHLYISTDSPYKFFCQRCESSGIVNDELLNNLDIYDDELQLAFYKNAKVFKRNTTINNGSISYLKFNTPKFPKYDIAGKFKEKLQYLEDRMGIKFTKSDLLRHRFIGSLEDFLILNGMGKLLNDEKMSKDCYLVDKHAIGWLSRDSTHVSFRFIGGNFKKRFKTICLDPYGEGSKVYSIKNKVDLMASEIEVIMCEGVFDIVSVYNNFYKTKDNTNRIFCAIIGKGFNLFPLSLMRMGFLNVNLHIYSDNDISLDDYKYILPFWRYNKISISYNMFKDQKDFGVKRELILPKSFKLK